MNVIRYIHEWTCENNNIVFFTFPMIHIGTKDFYKTISDEIENLNCVLLEGVPLKRSELGTYIKLAKQFDLSSQSESLKIPSDMNTQNIDMDPTDFKKGISDLHFKDKWRLFYISFFLKFPLLLKKDLAINDLRKMYYYPPNEEYRMMNPLNHYAFKHKEKSSLDLLIQNTRDEVINKNLETVIKENRNRDFRYDIGILFGDNHMPYIYQTLNKNKFKLKL